MTEYDYALNELLQEAIRKLDNFPEDFKCIDKLDAYLKVTDKIFQYLQGDDAIYENPDFVKLKNHYVNWFDDDCEEVKITKFRESISRLLLKNSKIWKEKFDEDGSVWEKIDEFIVGRTFDVFTNRIPLYYKNILDHEHQIEFEKMVDLIRKELINYYLNIFYCNKIIHFLNDEFSIDGVFISDITFLQRYLDVAASEMILVCTKLFSKEKSKNNENFGFEYLKNFIGKNNIKKREVNSILGDEVKKILNEGKNKIKELKEIRDGIIAHYDLKRVDELKKTKIKYELLEEMYELSVRLLEILSFNRFHRLTCVYPKLIKYNGFKKIVCQKMMPNTVDIDNYFEVLRYNFLPRLRQISQQYKDDENKKQRDYTKNEELI